MSPTSPRRHVATRVALLAFALLALYACRDITAPTAIGGLSPDALSATSHAIVSPDSMRGWAFYDDQHGVACSDPSTCRIAAGIGARASAGGGSVELAVSADTDGKAIILQGYAGTRFDRITDLKYSTFRQTEDAGSNLAIALQFNVDYDLTDQSLAYQGRVVFEPYQGAGGNVPTGTWQRWDARAGRWWGTRATVRRSDQLVTNPCVQATPCTWTQILAEFPNIGVHPTFGAVVLKAGSGWTGFRGNVDSLSIGVDGIAMTYDFEPVTESPIHLQTDIGTGVVGTQLPVDTVYTGGATVAYSFAAAPGHEAPYVVLDDTLAPLTGSIVMDRSHTLEVVADTAYSLATMSEDGKQIAQRINALLTSGDKASAYTDLMSFFVQRLNASANEATLARDNELAWYLTVDPTRDAAALAAIDDALIGTTFSIIRTDPHSAYVTYSAPGVLSRSRASSPTRSIGHTNAARLQPSTGPSQVKLPQQQLDDPQEPTVIVFVNGIASDLTSSDGTSGVTFTTSRLERLVKAEPRFANSKTRVDFVYNRTFSAQMAGYDSTHTCVANGSRGISFRNFLSTVARYAGCKGERLLRAATTIDVVEAATARFQLISHIAPTNPDVAAIANYVNAHRTQSEIPEHVIFVAHSEGALLVAQALRTLPALEQHPIQEAQACVATLALASAADRGLFDLDDPYRLGFIVAGDAILNTLVLGWDILPTPASDSSRRLVARVDEKKRDMARLKAGVELHKIEVTYLKDSASRGAIVDRLTKLHKECLQGELRVFSDTITTMAGSEFTLQPKLFNQNDRELHGRLMWKDVPDEITALDTNRFLARTPRDYAKGILYQTPYLAEYAWVRIPLSPITGTSIHEDYSSSWELIAASNGGLGNPPYGYEQPPTDTWSGAGELCADDVTIYGRSPSYGVYRMHCSRGYTVTAGTASTSSVAAQVKSYGISWIPNAPYGLLEDLENPLRRACNGPEKCLSHIVVDAYDSTGTRVATSGPFTPGGGANLSIAPALPPLPLGSVLVSPSPLATTVRPPRVRAIPPSGVAKPR
jgi:hypothetical protein